MTKHFAPDLMPFFKMRHSSAVGRVDTTVAGPGHLAIRHPISRFQFWGVTFKTSPAIGRLTSMKSILGPLKY
jgi:hypothetical protein